MKKALQYLVWKNCSLEVWFFHFEELFGERVILFTCQFSKHCLRTRVELQLTCFFL